MMERTLCIMDRLSRAQAERELHALKRIEAKLRACGGLGNYSNMEIRCTFEHGQFEGLTTSEWGVFVTPLV